MTNEQIVEGMEVIGSDGGMVGRVKGLHHDHLHIEPTIPTEGGDNIVPRSWVARVDSHVHLNRDAALVRDTWGEGHAMPIGRTSAAGAAAGSDAGGAFRHEQAHSKPGGSWIVWALGALLLLIVVILGIRGFGYAASDTSREQPAVDAPDV